MTDENQCPVCGMFMTTERRNGFNLPEDMPLETYCKRCGYEGEINDR